MISIVTYNCNQGRGNIKRLSKILENSDADVICLQEFNSKVKDNINLKGYILVEPSIKQGWFKNVIYTKYPPIKISFISLSTLARSVPAIKILVGHKKLTIVNVHLTSGSNKLDVRQSELRHIFSQIGRPRRIIITGDFNMRADEESPSNDFAFCTLVPTYCSSNPVNISNFKYEHPFDRFLYRDVSPVSTPNILGNNTRKPSTTPSDHYGLLCHFSFPPIDRSVCNII